MVLEEYVREAKFEAYAKSYAEAYAKSYAEAYAEAYAESYAEGVVEGCVLALQSAGLSKEEIIHKMKELYGLDDVAAQRAIERYWAD